MKESIIRTIVRDDEREVLIFLKNNFRYRGKIIKYESDSILIDDVRDGLMALSLDEISTVRCSK